MRSVGHSMRHYWTVGGQVIRDNWPLWATLGHCGPVWATIGGGLHTAAFYTCLYCLLLFPFDAHLLNTLPRSPDSPAGYHSYSSPLPLQTPSPPARPTTGGGPVRVHPPGGRLQVPAPLHRVPQVATSDTIVVHTGTPAHPPVLAWNCNLHLLS